VCDSLREYEQGRSQGGGFGLNPPLADQKKKAIKVNVKRKKKKSVEFVFMLICLGLGPFTESLVEK